MTAASIALRPVIREIMRAAPSRRWSEAALIAQCRTLDPSARAVDVQAAVVWNQGQGYLASSYNAEMECDMWSLTDAGKSANPNA